MRCTMRYFLSKIKYMLTVNQKAPDFSLPDQDGVLHTLSQYKGKNVLLYFYPKDDTAGCTTEACTLRDNVPQFTSINAVVLGVSCDTVASHKKFHTKYKLTFPILADEQKQVVQLYEVYGKKKFMGREYMGINRVSYLINADGLIANVYETVKPALHAQEVITDLQSLS